MKRQPSEWKEIFFNKLTNRGLISKLYKQLIQLIIKNKPHNTIKNQAEHLKSHFSKANT